VDPSLFLATFGVIFLAEMGDKTQLAAMTLATRYPPRRAFVGIALAFALLDAVAVGVGQGLFALVPLGWIQAASAALFLFFAVRTWRAEDESEDEVRRASKARPIAASFAVILVSELGDKTQIAVASLAAQHAAPATVFLAATLALWAVSGLGLWAGAKLAQRVPAALIRRAAAAAFLAFAAVTGWQALRTFGVVR